MNEYLTPIEAERVMQMNTTCLIAYMDAGLLPFERVNGIRMISRSNARKLMRRHRKLTRQFMDYLYDNQFDPEIIHQAVSDREGVLYFLWISSGKSLPLGEPATR